MNAPQPSKSPSPPSVRPRPARRKNPLVGVGEPFENYTKLTNAYFDLIENNKLSGAVQRDLILLIMKYTWGDEHRPEFAAIALTTFSTACGKVDTGTIARELKDLTARHLIENGKTQGCKTGLGLYKLTPEKWKDADPYEPKETTENEAAPAKPPNDKLIVRPGRKAACVPARLLRTEGDPVDHEFRFQNAGTDPVEISTSMEPGFVLFTFQSTPAKRTKSERLRPTDSRQKANTEANNRLTDFTIAISAILQSQFEIGFDPAAVPLDRLLLNKVMEAAGPELPTDTFDQYTRRHIQKMRKGKPDETHTPGLLISLAKQAAVKYQAFKDRPAMPQPTPRAVPRPPVPVDPSVPWDRVKIILCSQMSPHSYSNWIERTRQLAATSNSITVAVPDEGTREYIEDELKDIIAAACRAAGQPENIIWKVEA